MNTISAVVTTFNNADTLQKCLESLRFCDELIVLDSGSTDGTRDIAEKYSAKVQIESFKGYGPQKQSAIDKAGSDWVLLLDADEYVGEDAADIIREAIAQDSIDGYRLPRREWLFWQWPHALTRPNWHLRLFRKTKASMNQVPVHAAPEVHGRIENLKLDFYHFGEKNLAQRVEKINRYSSGLLEQKKQKSFLTLRILFYPSFVFFRLYILKRYFLNGWAGYFAARTQAFYAFLKYAKRLERNKQQERDDA
ncbi:MAG: glycosyltransferase family 2 protein [Arenimonas sp.]